MRLSSNIIFSSSSAYDSIYVQVNGIMQKIMHLVSCFTCIIVLSTIVYLYIYIYIMYTCKYINLCTKTRGMLNLSFYTTVAADQKTQYQYQIPSFNVPMIRHLVSDNFWPWAIDFHRVFTICSWFICKIIYINTKYVYNMHIIVIHIYLKSHIDGIHISHIYIISFVSFFCIFWVNHQKCHQPPTSNFHKDLHIFPGRSFPAPKLPFGGWWLEVPTGECGLVAQLPPVKTMIPWYPPRHPDCCDTYGSIYCGTM